MNLYRAHVLICGGTGCHSSNSDKIREKLEAKIKEKGLENEVKVVMTGCFGLCESGPNVVVYPEGVFYSHVKLSDVDEIVEEHLLKGRVVRRLLFKEALEEDTIKSVNEVEFYKKQTRIALKNCGIIDPENIEEYIALDGYQSLAKCITQMSREEVIKFVKDSGLRGRGGAGFPTGMKWEFTAKASGDKKYVVCNADEGDPGAFMDRSVLEGDPHRIIEGMTIAGYAIGAKEGIIYCRAEYPLAIKRLEIAMDQARKKNYLGKNILGSNFNFDIKIKKGAGAFVCGEETALIASLEGERGMPRLKPPFPAQSGYWKKPTNINNVETYANVPWIIFHGPEKFAEMGTEKSKGTKVFALAGKIKNGGLAEIPMGMTLREVIYGIGGGIKDDKEFKAVQLGGPSGGCIPKELLDTPVTYEDINKTGAIVGSGGMIVMDETTCMVDITKFFLQFTCNESCGKCIYCRIGTKRMLEILEKITQGKAEMKDLDELESLAISVKDGSLCGLGQTAPNPVLTTLKYFRDEYIAHIVDKKCPAKKCTALLTYNIDPEVCIGCGACARNCPAGAISGTVKNPHSIDHDKCIKCGNCLNTCKFSAVKVD